MLVLTRRKDERIVIDGGIELVVTRVDGKKVGIGIMAPPHVKIMRKELLETKEEEQNNG